MMHEPVMVSEALHFLALSQGDFVIDCTLGSGGHAREFLRAVGPDGLVLGIETNPQTLREAGPGLACEGIRVHHGNFRDICPILMDGLYPAPDAVFFDLGLSSYLLEATGLGFSFKQGDEPLDMRMDPGQGIPASEVLAELSEGQLALLLRAYGEEPGARRIARSIVQSRPVSSVSDLVGAVERATRPGTRGKALHRVFQALRIFVNDEMGALTQGLAGALESMALGGRLVAISYHSLEDRLVKAAGRLGCMENLTPKPVVPTSDERKSNPRARSAKLRAMIKKGEMDAQSVAVVIGALCPSLPFGLA